MEKHWQQAWASVQGHPQHHLILTLVALNGLSLAEAEAVTDQSFDIEQKAIRTTQATNYQFYNAYNNVDIFATAVVIAIAPYTDIVEQANAGHHPTLASMDGTWYRWEATAPPIGVLPNLGLECQTYRLLPGDTFVCYSNDFSKIETPTGLWGDVGIISVLSQALTHPPSMIQAVLRAAEALQQGRSPHDDQTILSVHYSG